LVAKGEKEEKRNLNVPIRYKMGEHMIIAVMWMLIFALKKTNTPPQAKKGKGEGKGEGVL